MLYVRVVNLNWCSYLVTNGTAQYKVIDVPENDQYNLKNQSDCDPKVRTNWCNTHLLRDDHMNLRL